MPRAGLGASQHIKQSIQYTVLDTYLSGSSEDVLDKFSEPVEKAVYSSTEAEVVEEQLSTCWKSIVGKAAGTPLTDANMPRIVDLVIGLQSRPDLEKDGKAVQVEDMTVWRDLPTFGWQMREAWNMAADDRSDQRSKDEWLNINAFTAALVAAVHSRKNKTPDFSLYAIWTIRSGLEEDLDMVPEVAVAAASMWFTFAAPAIADFCRQSKSFEGRVAKGGFSFQDRGWTGFSAERWSAWEQRLKDVEGRVADRTAKDLVGQAIKAIDEVNA